MFAVSSLGRQRLILGHSWLRKHNPEIDWLSGEVRMSRCPPRCCPGCRDEARQERLISKARNRRKDKISAGPMPEMDHNSDVTNGDDLPGDVSRYEEGDWFLAVNLPPSQPSMDLCASSTISQWLAQAF